VRLLFNEEPLSLTEYVASIQPLRARVKLVLTRSEGIPDTSPRAGQGLNLKARLIIPTDNGADAGLALPSGTTRRRGQDQAAPADEAARSQPP
jgi:hypothetical protein